MKIKLEGKSAQYISMLGECVKRYKESAPELLKLFLIYADPDTGAVRDKLGILRILSTAVMVEKVLFVVEPRTLVTSIVVNGYGNGTDEIIKKSFGRTTMINQIYAHKAQSIVEKVDTLMWIKYRTWYSSLMRLKYVNLAREQVCLQELGAGVGMGYSFDKLTTSSTSLNKVSGE